MSQHFWTNRFSTVSSIFSTLLLFSCLGGLGAISSQAQVQDPEPGVKNGVFVVLRAPSLGKVNIGNLEVGALSFDHDVVVDCQCGKKDNFTVRGATLQDGKWQVLLFGSVNGSQKCPPAEIPIQGDLADTVSGKTVPVKGTLRAARNGVWSGTLTAGTGSPTTVFVQNIKFSQTSGQCVQATPVPATPVPATPTPVSIRTPIGDPTPPTLGNFGSSVGLGAKTGEFKAIVPAQGTVTGDLANQMKLLAKE